jgi:transposase
MNRRYSEEFKREAVRQVLERGDSVNEVPERLGVSTKNLYVWVSTKRRQQTGNEGDALQVMRQENTRLKTELRRAEGERDSLKKAAAYFARESG